jgi:hypothetical protein
MRKRGLISTAAHCVLGPYYFWKSYTGSLKYRNQPAVPDDFDRKHGTETARRVHPTDVKVKSANWINSVGYWPAPVTLVERAIRELDIHFQDFVFVDFGSGKGRVLLLASEFSFRSIIGVELVPELHAIALKNIQAYKSPSQKCRELTSVCIDLTQFRLPAQPLVAFLYNPASEDVITHFATNLAASLRKNPREIWVIYITPAYGHLFDSASMLHLRLVRRTDKYAVYTNAKKTPVRNHCAELLG